MTHNLVQRRLALRVSAANQVLFEVARQSPMEQNASQVRHPIYSTTYTIPHTYYIYMSIYNYIDIYNKLKVFTLE